MSQHDTVFGDVGRGATHFHAHQPVGCDKFELWDEINHRWVPNYDATSMSLWVHDELMERFGKLVVDNNNEVSWAPHSPPFDTITASRR